MSERTPNLDLPFIQPAQAQKHVTHNEAVERLDLIVQLAVQEFDADTPPATPAEGQVWVVGAAPTADWAGQSGAVACWSGGGWLFLTPQTGWIGWGVADAMARVFANGSWSPLFGDLNNLAGLGINATSDVNNRLSVASPATLLNHDGAGHQLKLNKAAAAETASLLYQTAFSGRAEMGLAGGDDFTIKVSADGAQWNNALSIAADTGVVTLAQVVNLAPGSAPVTAQAGDLYFDAALAKLRCHDGSVWQDLF